jgi:hypothetical protein
MKNVLIRDLVRMERDLDHVRRERRWDLLGISLDDGGTHFGRERAG